MNEGSQKVRRRRSASCHARSASRLLVFTLYFSANISLHAVGHNVDTVPEAPEERRRQVKSACAANDEIP